MRGRETHARCQVKIGGTAYRLPAADLEREFDRSAAVRAVVPGVQSVLSDKFNTWDEERRAARAGATAE